MEEDIEIENNEEFFRQRIENIKKGHYIEVRILISEDEAEFPCANLDIHGITEKQIAEMILCLDEMKKRLKKEYPMASVITKFMEIGGVIKESGNEN